MVGGIPKHLVTLADLNERFAILQAPGKDAAWIHRPDGLPVTAGDMAMRLESSVVFLFTDRATGKDVYLPAFKFWKGHARRHVYRSVAFTSKPTAPDVFNLFTGLGVVPKEGECGKILKHILEVICDDGEAKCKALLDLMAWQIQNIGKPSRVIVVLRNPNQQAGKGLLCEEILLKIYGPNRSGFSPSDTDQVLGRFNDTLRGTSFLFMDEVLFAGDRKAANAIKALATTTVKGIEKKGIPTVQLPIAVNLWLASNSDFPVHIEEGDARYWILDVSEHRIGDHDYFGALMKEAEAGGREAFAHFLLNRDVSGFLPQRDVPRDNTERRTAILGSLNPYDARVWLSECATCERILGSRPDTMVTYIDPPSEKEEKSPPLPGVMWTTGAAYTVCTLFEAYREWQRGVHTRVAPEPTPHGRFGELLKRAGWDVGKNADNRRTRKAPTPDWCLVALGNLENWKRW